MATDPGIALIADELNALAQRLATLPLETVLEDAFVSGAPLSDALPTFTSARQYVREARNRILHIRPAAESCELARKLSALALTDYDQSFKQLGLSLAEGLDDAATANCMVRSFRFLGTADSRGQAAATILGAGWPM